ncbi:aspartic peptidase domain-containing protein [Mycena olivaceomarginata]|nr:aspartic peptidase domain-containing protein [Mycena olivaceomarginata]
MNGRWYGSIQGKLYNIGTPPQDFTVVFDTGSDELVIPGTNCTTSCANQKKFDPTQSSTFKPNAGDGIFEESFLTGGDASPWGLKDWSMSLVEVSDTMTVGGLSVSNVSFLLIQNQSQPFSEDPYDGILGLSTTSSATSFFQGLINQGLPRNDLWFLYGPHSVGGAEMTLGGVDSSKFTSQTTFAPIVADGHGAWILNSSGIAVNGQTNDVLAVAYRSPLRHWHYERVLTASYGRGRAYHVLCIYSLTPNSQGALRVYLSRDPTQPNRARSVGYPVFKAFNVTIPSSEFIVGPFVGNNSLCQATFNSWPANFTIPPIIGNSLLKHYYTTWDSGNLALGFALICWMVELELNSIIQNLRNGFHDNT